MDDDVSEKARSRYRRTLWLAVISLCCACVLLIVLCLPFGGNTRESAKRTATLSFLKEIGVALPIYVEDHDDRLPLDMSSSSGVRNYLTPYVKRENPFRSLNPNSPEFLGNGSLASRVFMKVGKPESNLVFFDSAPWPDPKRAVSFLDSHAKFLKEPAFQETVANHWVLPEVTQQ